jgi:large subunit ribosomal protein L11
MAFCKDYNEQTSSRAGSIIPVEITVYEDRSFTFVTKTPPASDLLKRTLNIEKGSSTAGQQKSGAIPRAKLAEIAKAKMADLNTQDIEAATRIIEGTARSMGIEVE